MISTENLKNSSINNELLLMTIEIGLIPAVAAIKKQGCLLDYQIEQARSFASELAEKGDVIFYKSSKKGETAMLVSKLIKYIAIASFLPGGIKFCGIRYENIFDE